MNINNQAENKKPFGTRFFILLTVCMIVVATAVPASAATVLNNQADYPDSLPVKLPYPSVPDSVSANLPLDTSPPLKPGEEQYEHFILIVGYQSIARLCWIGIDDDTTYVVRNSNGKLNMYFDNFKYCYFYDNGEYGAVTEGTTDYLAYVNYLIYSPIELIDFDGNLFYSKPDLGQEVTSTLPTVLSWIQQTLNALFVEGGALQGLLLFVAVPVAITLLFLAARFIRNLFWGA